MADDKPQPTQKTLSDFVGNAKEQTAQKVQFITKFGFDAYEKLVANSRPAKK